MSFLDTILNVNIVATSATPSVPNFGTPAIYAYHTHNTDLIRTYFDATDMLSDGFTATEPAYLMAQVITSQNPRPPSFKVIRATTAAAHQTMTFQVTDSNVGDTVGFTMLDSSGNTTVLNDVVDSGDSTTDIATELAALTLTGATLTSLADTVTISVNTAGAMMWVSNIKGGKWQDTTALAATHPSADLDAVVVVDNDWYGLSIMHLDPSNIANVAAWTESNGKKIFAYTTADFDAANTTSGGGVFLTLKTSNYARSYGQWSGTPADYGALALMAQRLTADPGSDTWAYKELNGVAADSLSATQTTDITAGNGNFYISVANVPVTFDGRAASGLFMDITRGVDALRADIQTRIFTLLINSPKVPYTRKGIAAVGGEVSAALSAAVGTGFISNDAGEEFSVTLPDIKNVSTSDKQNRLLKNVKFVAVAQGAIHKVVVNGTVVI